MNSTVGTPLLVWSEYNEGRIEAVGHDWLVIRLENGRPWCEEFDGPKNRDQWVQRGIEGLRSKREEEGE